jgi:hypothetical protein
MARPFHVFLVFCCKSSEKTTIHQIFGKQKNGTIQEMEQNGLMEDPKGSHVTSLSSLLQLLFH